MATTDVNSYVIREQGSTKFTVLSGGEFEVQSGGKVDLQSGSTVDVAGNLVVNSGGDLSVESGGTFDLESGHIAYVKGYTTHATTADGRIANYGHSYIVPTSSGIKFRMNAPAAGIEKFITINSTVRTVVCASTVAGGTNQYFGIVHASTLRYMVMKHLGGGGCLGMGHTVHLRALSTSRWCVMNRPSTLGIQFTTST